jgi:hypothetical protein
MTGLSIGETGVANKEKQRHHPSVLISSPAFALYVTVNRSLGRKGALRERENSVRDRQRLDGQLWLPHPPLPASAPTCDIESVIR